MTLEQRTHAIQMGLIENTFEFFAKDLSLLKGEMFFESLGKFLWNKFELDYIFIDHIPNKIEKNAETIIFLINGCICENISYDLMHTPCEKVYGKKMCCYTENVQTIFPKDKMLSELNVQSYIGIPLWDSENNPIGLIGMMGTKHIHEKDIMEIVLKIVSIKASQELESQILNNNIFEKNKLLGKLLDFQTILFLENYIDDLFVKFEMQLKQIIGDFKVQTYVFSDNTNQYYKTDFTIFSDQKFADLIISKAHVTNNYIYSQLDKLRNSEDNLIVYDRKITTKIDSFFDHKAFLFIEIDEKIHFPNIVKSYINTFLFRLKDLISINKMEKEKLEVFISLGDMIEKRDKSVSSHVKNVSEGSYKLAMKCGFDDQSLLDIEIASSIHDIGKILVSDTILNKPGRLTSEEFDQIKLHTTDSFERLKNHEGSLSKKVYNIMRYHHENWDGSGYPEGLIGEQIPLEARIVSVIDVFEALTHKRSYKEDWTYPDAVEFIKNNSGKKFDPEIVQNFLQVSEEIYFKFTTNK